MKKAAIITTIILFLLLLKFLFTFIINEVVIVSYNQGVYQEDLISLLEKANWQQPYIVYYNRGNIYHKKKQYNDAIDDYEKALKKNPPIEKKCDIRINMTISMIERINTNKKSEYIKALEEAKENLYKDHCADSSDDSGESEEAEQLEDEINEQLDELKNNNSSSEGEETEDPNKETEEEQNIEAQLEEINKDANISRQNDLQTYENLGNYQYYSGKNW